MWGPDAMEFRPERWLESSNEKTETPLGMYANLYVLRLLDKPRLTYFRYTKAHFLRGGKRVYRLEVRVSHRLQIQWDVAETHSTHQNSLVETQAFLVTLIREFSFSIPEGRKVRTARPGILVPMVVGEEDKGPQLPLIVTPVRDF